MESHQEIEDLILQIKIELCENKNALIQRLIYVGTGVLSPDEFQGYLIQIEQIQASIQRKEEAIIQLQALSGYLYCASLNAAHLRRNSF